MKTKYIVFDGMDGSGKGTQMKLLKEKFGSQVVFTREPGGTPFAEEIREILVNNPLAGKSTALNNFFLFWAAREELQENLFVPALRMGKHVFSDRGDSSTFAFQLYGEEHEELVCTFLRIRELVFGGNARRRQPDLYVIFDLPAEIARERATQDTSRTTSHFDVRDLEYYQRVRKGFEKFSRYVLSVRFIDADRTPLKIHQEVLTVLRDRVGVS